MILIKPIRDFPLFRLSFSISIVGLFLFILLVTGCRVPVVLRVPPGVDHMPLRDDLERSVEFNNRIDFKIISDATSDATIDEFMICSDDVSRCASLEFTYRGVETSIYDAISLLVDDLGFRHVVLAFDYERRRIADRLDIGPEANVRIQRDDETANAFVESLAAELVNSDVGMILLLGRRNGDVLRRVGVTEARPRVICDFFLPASGERLKAAGFPLAGVIGYDWPYAVNRYINGDVEEDTINVPMQLFRY